MNLKEKLNKRELILGTWVIAPSVYSLDAICASGLDFVILDQEHGSISQNNLLALINTAKANNCYSLVRPPSINADGIQVPNVETFADAKRVIDYSKYPDIGSRGYSPFIPSSRYSNNGPLWNKKMNNNLVTGINVEGEDGIKNIDEIMRLEEIDVIFVGLFDLSKALGIPGNVHDEKVSEMLKSVIEKGARYNKSIGTIATSKKHMGELIKLGLNFIVYLVDMNILFDSYKNIQETFDQLKSIKDIKL